MDKLHYDKSCYQRDMKCRNRARKHMLKLTQNVCTMFLYYERKTQIRTKFKIIPETVQPKTIKSCKRKSLNLCIVSRNVGVNTRKSTLYLYDAYEDYFYLTKCSVHLYVDFKWFFFQAIRCLRYWFLRKLRGLIWDSRFEILDSKYENQDSTF